MINSCLKELVKGPFHSKEYKTISTSTTISTFVELCLLNCILVTFRLRLLIIVACLKLFKIAGRDTVVCQGSNTMYVCACRLVCGCHSQVNHCYVLEYFILVSFKQLFLILISLLIIVWMNHLVYKIEKNGH